MTMDEIISFVAGLDDVLALTPEPGDGTPEIAWGDTFFYYSPDGVVPQATQPFATIVTKDYPGDDKSELDRPEAFRVNVAAGKETFVRWTGHSPRDSAEYTDDPSASDVVIAHPVYGSLGWLAIKNQASGQMRHCGSCCILPTSSHALATKDEQARSRARAAACSTR
jgi:hypothetical protein